MGSNFMDEIDCGSFFDQIDDFIEFPPENECGSFGSGDGKDFPSMWNDALPETDPFFPGSHSNSGSDLSTELAVPYEDIVQLEWLSTFVEDSFAEGGMTMAKQNSSVNNVSSHNQFETSSPVSVLESSSSCSAEKSKPLSPTHRGPQRARSKRPRPATFNPRPAIQLISPSSSFIETPQPFVAPAVSSESENFAESQPFKNGPHHNSQEQKKKKKKKKLMLTFSSAAAAETNQNPPAQAVRKCLHCEITKTPQWRTGPLGPKTLCNACGVRFKSGRLFPEYRPAASPTFIPSLHSNSHKKVIEMRNKVLETNPAGIALTSPKTTQAEPIPDSTPIASVN